MKPNYLLVLASIFLLISTIFAIGPEKNKRKKYRIVKIYGRKLKPTVPPESESSILTPEMSESRITNSSVQYVNQPSRLLTDKIFHGEMNFEDFDVNKLLAATGHGGDPSGPRIIQVSAPSSNSHLDPEYLSKLISEQLGHSAEYTILPSLGGEGTHTFPASSDHRDSYSVPPPPPSARPPYSAQVSSFSKYATTQPPKRSEYSYPNQNQVVKSHYTGRTVTSPPVRVQDYSSGSIKSSHSAPIISSFENSHSELKPTPRPYTKPNLGSPVPGYRQTPAPVYSPPASGYSHPPRVFSTREPYHYSSPAPNYESVSVSSVKKYPYQPPSPNSKILSYSQPALTTPSTFVSPSKDYSHVKTQAPATNYNSAFPSSHYSGDNNSGYSTLGREMTAPGLAPAAKGEYGAPEPETAPPAYDPPTPTESRPKSKYASSLVRGYTSGSEGDAYKSEPYRAPKSIPEKWRVVEPYVSSQDNTQNQAPAFSSDGYVWTKGPTETYNFLNQAPTKSYTLSSGSSSGYVPPNPADNGYRSFNPDYQAQHPPSYQGNPGISPGGLHPSIDNATPETYEPYSPPKSPPNNYGPPETPSPTYGPSVEEKRPVLSKTIYVNLPAEPTTPKPYRPPVLPQRHYKIVFIKAPTHATPEEPEIETTPAPESKTLIYVLHQKQKPPPKIVIPTAAPTPPSKPEVHFIQYKDVTTTTPRTRPGYDHTDSGEYGYDSPYSNTGQDQDGEYGYRTSYSKRGPSEVQYDLSSSSSTIHVNVQKSISDKNKH